MEKLLKTYDKEFMRMAMLKHEETFKEQVYELHRLYGIQKMLMGNKDPDRINFKDQKHWSLKNDYNSEKRSTNPDDIQRNFTIKLDLERPIGESNCGSKVLEIIDESEIELTLGPSSGFNRRKKPETPLNSDSGPSFSSSSTGSSHIKLNRTNSYELRLY